ncbi:MAG TPA: TIGR01906 family membrane protein, partial [Candidatus Nesterenkonia stercoripullorum]|nr:TIGR01906 family membrane protein [Candidatus Nesterenkonia stercoripullorum]
DTNATRPINATLSDGERTTTLPATGADSAEADSPRADATAAIPAAAEQPKPASPADPREPARGTEPRVGRHGRADVEGRETDRTAYNLDSGEAITDADLDAEVSRSKRGVSRFFQVLIAIFLPVIVIAAAIRLVASPAFLWLAYNRPGFPADTGDFGTGDRLLYGSYGVDYLFNAANSRYLSELAPGGEALFTADEVTHMTDVKWVIFWTMIAAAALLVLAVIFALLLRSWRPGGVARGIFAGAWVTLGLIVTVAVLAFLNFGAFFTEFHRLLFDDGTWTFSADSTLIRLYPEQFWIDAGIAVAAVVLIISVLALIMTWPTKRRRARRAARFEEVKARRREKLIAELNKDAGYSPATH